MTTLRKSIVTTCFFFGVFQLFAGGLDAQNISVPASWESKAIADWNEADVKSVLNDSAWSKVIKGTPSQSMPRIGTAVNESSILFTLRSALIVRYAVIRSVQLKARYDTLDMKAKTDLEKKLKPVLECPECDRFYIIAVVGDSYLLSEGGRVQGRAKRIYLSNEKGERRELVKYSPSTGRGSNALFFFNRFDANGKPLLSADNTTLTFTFDSEVGDDPVIGLLKNVEIKVKDIVRQGQVIF